MARGVGTPERAVDVIALDEALDTLVLRELKRT